MIRQPICAAGVGDVDLNHHQVRAIREVQPLNMFVLDARIVVRPKVRRKRGEAERRKQRVLDGTPVRAGGFGERREDELDVQAANGHLRREPCVI